MPPVADDRIRTVAADILSHAPYSQWRPQGSIEWLFRFLDAIRDFFHWLDVLADTRPLLYAGLMLTLLALSVGLGAHIFYSLRLALRRPLESDRAAGADARPGLAEDAQRLAAAGQFLDAAHHMQLAVIELLLQRGVLDLARSEPNRTLRARLRQARLPGAERDDLMGLIDQLERQWFRDRRPDPRLYEAWCRLHARLTTLPAVA